MLAVVAMQRHLRLVVEEEVVVVVVEAVSLWNKTDSSGRTIELGERF